MSFYSLHLRHINITVKLTPKHLPPNIKLSLFNPQFAETKIVSRENNNKPPQFGKGSQETLHHSEHSTTQPTPSPVHNSSMATPNKGKGGPMKLITTRKEVNSLFSKVELEITQMNQQTKPLDLSKILEAIEILEKYTTASSYNEKYLRKHLKQLVTHKRKLWDVHEHVGISELVDQKIELKRVLRLVGRASGKVEEGRGDRRY
jgi:hypothetical protein